MMRLRLLESVVINANDAVMITEAAPSHFPGPRIIYANAAFYRMTGFEPGEIIGNTPRVLQGPGTDARVRERLREAFSHWERVQAELINYRKDGSPFWVELSISPVADETGLFTHWVSVQREVTERKATEERTIRALVAEAENAVLQRRANYDELTGILNRSAFHDRLAVTLGAANAEKASSAVLFLDLDHFKRVNDALGHQVGDLLLKDVAHRLELCLGPGDVVARIGGDEFACLLFGIDSQLRAIETAKYILDVIRLPMQLSDISLCIGASIGINFLHDRHTSPEDVVRDADIAMYAAKNRGGGGYAIFDDEMHSRVLKTLRIQAELSVALERGEFQLYFQPIVEMSDRRVVGFEALIRWFHPQQGMIAPGDFIAVAEDTGLIVGIGRWILEEACRHAKRWNASRSPDDIIIVSVNVSSRQLSDQRFFEVVRDALARSELDARALQIEITESVLIERSEDTARVLERIRNLGINVSLDDFGTGYSSLGYIQHYSIDSLKIDRSFVSQMTESKTTAEIVRVILGLARALFVEVTAEGIETTEQVDMLVSAGCKYGQGFLFGRPLCVTDVDRLLCDVEPETPPISSAGGKIKADL